MRRGTFRAVAGLGLALVLIGGAVAACGDDGDDGASVRDVGGEGSESASGSGSGSGSASGSGSGSASGSAAPECEPVGDPASADTTVNVGLDEWVIEPASPNAPAGKVLFANENVGEEPHELVVVKGPTPTDLPLDADGALDEAKLPDGALVGEVEAFPAGETCDGVFELEAAEYTLLCNIVETEEDGTVEAHLAEGMVTTFTVTAP